MTRMVYRITAQLKIKYGTVEKNISESAFLVLRLLAVFRSLITEVWNVLQESTIRYVSNTMFLPLIVR